MSCKALVMEPIGYDLRYATTRDALFFPFDIKYRAELCNPCLRRASVIINDATQSLGYN